MNNNMTEEQHQMFAEACFHQSEEYEKGYRNAIEHYNAYQQRLHEDFSTGYLAAMVDIYHKRIEFFNNITYYSDIEQAIIRYTIDTTQTAGELTREILKIIKIN
jgi:flagellar biosynthesis chaperone FliJ